MTLIFFFFVPVAWAVTGRLLGACVAHTVATESAERFGATLGRWCMWIFPAVVYVLLFTGISGDAGHGVVLFGSDVLLAAVCASIYIVPVLILYVLVTYVVRDVVRGLRSRS